MTQHIIHGPTAWEAGRILSDAMKVTGRELVSLPPGTLLLRLSVLNHVAEHVDQENVVLRLLSAVFEKDFARNLGTWQKRYSSVAESRGIRLWRTEEQERDDDTDRLFGIMTYVDDGCGAAGVNDDGLHFCHRPRGHDGAHRCVCRSSFTATVNFPGDLLDD